jgi:hypothetical protein
LKEFLEVKSDVARHYKCIRIVSWEGEIILSGFLRFLKLRQNLFTEISFFLLTPIKEEYRNIDEISHKFSWRKGLQLLYNTFGKTLLLFVCAIFLLIGGFFEPVNNWRKQRSSRQMIRENRMFDYGAIKSIRELASSAEYNHYFQKLDKEMFIKVVERQILDAITTFLDEHNIDTSDLKSRQDTILNNGVVITGGEVKAHNITSGNKAKSVIKNMVQNVSSMTDNKG